MKGAVFTIGAILALAEFERKLEELGEEAPEVRRLVERHGGANLNLVQVDAALAALAEAIGGQGGTSVLAHASTREQDADTVAATADSLSGSTGASAEGMYEVEDFRSPSSLPVQVDDEEATETDLTLDDAGLPSEDDDTENDRGFAPVHVPQDEAPMVDMHASAEPDWQVSNDLEETTGRRPGAVTAPPSSLHAVGGGANEFPRELSARETSERPVGLSERPRFSSLPPVAHEPEDDTVRVSIGPGEGHAAGEDLELLDDDELVMLDDEEIELLG